MSKYTRSIGAGGVTILKNDKLMLQEEILDELQDFEKIKAENVILVEALLSIRNCQNIANMSIRNYVEETFSRIIIE
jgi:hypothetical protein